MFQENRRDAEGYMLDHLKCILCHVLIGPGHYSVEVDSKNRCGTCGSREVPV
ncbi:hypothetical protein LCGC14_2613800 [marine sediment metagenome]|uniref:Uncharacterized protein n=1 Tax=marine sediment metagenome TaxID=412755 RepID=A0A0F9CXR5_9ZZZZ